MRKNLLLGIGGLIIGYFAMTGLLVILQEWLVISELLERERIRSVVLQMVRDERSKS